MVPLMPDVLSETMFSVAVGRAQRETVKDVLILVEVLTETKVYTLGSRNSPVPRTGIETRVKRKNKLPGTHAEGWRFLINPLDLTEPRSTTTSPEASLKLQ